MDGLDFCSVLQGPTITKVNAILRNIDIVSSHYFGERKTDQVGKSVLL